MRTKYSILNIATGIGSQIVITLLSFVSRTIFIQFLGAEYLGVNGLFGNILGMLSLAEAGIGSAIIYNLYKPMSDNDTEKINVLMKFYRKAYIFISFIVILLGISLIPFLPFITGNSHIENITLIYIIFLVNTASSYLFQHKISFLNVAQKGYIVTAAYTVSSIFSILIKWGILFFTKSFILYLLVDIIMTIGTSFILTGIVNKKYPFLTRNTKSKLDKATKSNIVTNVKALILHNIGGYAVFGTDNILIASFINLKAVGLYSNYYMLFNLCRTFINQIFDNINYSVGNLVASESKEKVYSVFKVMMFFNFWIYSFFATFLYVIIEPFIKLWIGPEYLMGKGVLIILLLNFYVSGMRRSITMVKTTSGIFHEDRYAPFFEAGVNLFSSIVLVHYFGIAGIFLGTFISTLLVPFWISPYLVYKKVFDINLTGYFKRYLLYFLLFMIVAEITSLTCSIFPSENLLYLLLKMILSLVIPNVIFLVIFKKTEEFTYLSKIIGQYSMKTWLKFRSYKNFTHVKHKTY
ncbi:hypothetical protein LRR81_02865 [Metabacillus sp. GX 13764]|uniref:lipopolysaccharide biosynthesis protein n=1 Tax=Metabacillus kandeliae TaxID=2900151 RepID=UPI001E35C34D|nr:hypothetical protein [Metabacillus kandeliae]MCD7033156.1 hypothetical protein [Metabacillus kandeliae]